MCKCPCLWMEESECWFLWYSAWPCDSGSHVWTSWLLLWLEGLRTNLPLAADVSITSRCSFIWSADEKQYSLANRCLCSSELRKRSVSHCAVQAHRQERKIQIDHAYPRHTQVALICIHETLLPGQNTFGSDCLCYHGSCCDFVINRDIC